jgi:glucose/arabinose dehydrogenase
MRNTVGWDFHPETGVLYFSDNGMDSLGDNAPDCELNRLTGPFPQEFGHPFCYS